LNVRQAEFDPAALEDLLWWVQHDRKTALRTLRLVQETLRTPFEGTGKPEPLRHELRGAWSRRITQEHRLVYVVTESQVRFIACRYHYR
jgi:toxin YoeB